MSDRFTFDSYVFVEKKPMSDIKINNANLKKLVEDALKIGRAISIIFHEINHNIYSYLLYFYNNINYSFLTHRKSKLNEFREGGLYMEFLLFGRIIEILTLEEALYIMNIDNYDKDIKSFQKDFLNLNKKSKINGIFSNFNKIYEMNDYNRIKNSIIKTKTKTQINSFKEITIDIQIGKKWVSGINRDIDIKAFNEFFKNYHCIK